MLLAASHVATWWIVGWICCLGCWPRTCARCERSTIASRCRCFSTSTKVSASSGSHSATLNIIKPPQFHRTVLRSRYSLAYPQAQALTEGRAVPVIENPYHDSASPYQATGAAVDEKDWQWLRKDVSLLMRSGETGGT